MENLALVSMGLPARKPFRPRLWVLLFVASAMLFLGGAGSFWFSGARHAAMVGVAGALAAVLVIVAFSGRDPRRRG